MEFICLRRPRQLPDWCAVSSLPGTNGYWKQGWVDVLYPELIEELDWLPLHEVLDAYGFSGVVLIDGERG